MFGIERTTIDAIIAELPGGAAMLAKFRKQTFEDRRAHVLAIERAQLTHADRIAGCLEAERAAFALLKKKTLELTHAAQAHTQAKGALHSARAALTFEMRQHEAALTATADPRILEFRQNLQKLYTDVCRQVATDERPGPRNPMTDKRDRPIVYSNAPGVKACLDAIIRAREACDALPLLAIEDLPGEIARLRESIPLSRLKVLEQLTP